MGDEYTLRFRWLTDFEARFVSWAERNFPQPYRNDMAVAMGLVEEWAEFSELLWAPDRDLRALSAEAGDVLVKFVDVSTWLGFSLEQAVVETAVDYRRMPMPREERIIGQWARAWTKLANGTRGTREGWQEEIRRWTGLWFHHLRRCLVELGLDERKVANARFDVVERRDWVAHRAGMAR